MSIPNLNCKLPYNKDNLLYVDVDNRFNINGKNLNEIPKELFTNDQYIQEKLLFFYKTLKELTGENIDGLIDHINIFSSKITDIKNNDELLAQEKFNFLKLNDCNINIEDLFPCEDINSCNVLAYFDNTHIQYTEPYEPNCNTCDPDIVDCDS